MRSKLIAAMEIEQTNSKTNGLKIKNNWRKIMRSAKMEALKKDVEILSQVPCSFQHRNRALASDFRPRLCFLTEP